MHLKQAWAAERGAPDARWHTSTRVLLHSARQSLQRMHGLPARAEQ